MANLLEALDEKPPSKAETTRGLVQYLRPTRLFDRAFRRISVGDREMDAICPPTPSKFGTRFIYD